MRLGRQKSPKSSINLTIFISLLTFLCFAVIFDLYWASSSSTSYALRFVTVNLTPVRQSPRLDVTYLNHTSDIPVMDRIGWNDLLWKLFQFWVKIDLAMAWPTLSMQVQGKDPKNYEPQGRVLSATFADLPAPELHWEKMAPAPVPRLDGAAIQIKNLLFVFAGYGTINYVHSHVDIYNFTDNTWGGKFDMPKEMAHSHLGMVTDERYIYIVNGQYGPQCRGATAHTFVLDTETKQWSDLPPLPTPRYAPATQLWRGRLHVMGGSGVNRYTAEVDHWSLAVKDGKPLEKEWRSEIPIPRGGPHRACVVVDDRLMVIGGQEGDFMAKPGSPIFKCSRRLEVVYSDVLMLDGDMKWKNLPPMPKPDSHIEFAWALVNHSILIVGGTTDKHPNTKKMILNREIFRFDLDTLKWSVIGKLPYRVKTTLVGHWNGWLYFTSGQRDRGPDDPAPRKVLGDMWRTKLSF